MLQEKSGSGWGFGNLIASILPKRKGEVHLPPDRKKKVTNLVATCFESVDQIMHFLLKLGELKLKLCGCFDDVEIPPIMYIQLLYTYKFLRDIIFAVFAGNLSSTKIKSLNFFKIITMHMELKG